MDKVAVIWDALRDLVSFVPFTQREKQPWRSVTFSKVTGFSPQLCQKEHSYLGVFHVFKLYKWYQIAQSITCKIIKLIEKRVQSVRSSGRWLYVVKIQKKNLGLFPHNIKRMYA